MDGRFLTAFIIPKTWDVIGYKLNPFSLRYAMTLIAINSPLVDGRPPSTPEHVMMFLRVCSSHHPSEAFRDPTLMDYVRVARLQVDQRYFHKTVMEMLKYMEVCNTCPKVYQKPDASTTKRSENIPGPLSMVTSLMSKLNMPSEEAWNMTLGQAIWYLTAHAVSEGADIKVLGTEEEERAPAEKEALIKYQEAMRAELAAQRKKSK